jgi:hypothetical protein
MRFHGVIASGILLLVPSAALGADPNACAEAVKRGIAAGFSAPVCVMLDGEKIIRVEKNGEVLLNATAASCNDVTLRLYQKKEVANQQANVGGTWEVADPPVSNFAAQCGKLFAASKKAEPSARVPAETPSAPGDGRGNGEKPREGDGIGVAQSKSLKELFQHYRATSEPRGGAAYLATGAATADVVAEAAQILGQIVVNRATQAAYQQISVKVQQGLGCDPDELEDADKDKKLAATVKFPATCNVLKTLRIQEIAMARQALLRALISDVTAELNTKAKLAAATQVFVTLLVDSAVRAIIATVTDSRHTRHIEIANAIVDELISLANQVHLAGTMNEENYPPVIGA